MILMRVDIPNYVSFVRLGHVHITSSQIITWSTIHARIVETSSESDTNMQGSEHVQYCRGRLGSNASIPF